MAIMKTELDNTLCQDCVIFLPYNKCIIRGIEPERKPENCCIFIYDKTKEGCKVYENL